MKIPGRLSLIVCGIFLLVTDWQAVAADRIVLSEAPSVTHSGYPSKIDLNFEAMAERIVGALKLREGERVLIRFDPDYFGELVAPLRRRIRAAGAVDIDAIEYVAIAQGGMTSRRQAPAAKATEFERLLDSVDVYLWLPVRSGVREIPQPDALALGRWLDKGGSRREIHFHWASGSVLPDGLSGPHSSLLDTIYQDALDIDYGALSAAQDHAIAALRSGTVRVRTASGTDLSFRVGDRPFNKQNGDASPERMKTARIRIDREIELPAGVLRVAPLEETVNGKIVIPSARFGDQTARNIRLRIDNGQVTRVEADKNLTAVQAALTAGGDAAHCFREFGLGLNPKLQAPMGTPSLAYYGYGAGVVRLSLGDNQELGGSVRGNFVRWFFFPDATVEVGGQALVRDGKLVETSR